MEKKPEALIFDPYHLNVSLTAEQIKSECQKIIEEYRLKINIIVAIPENTRTFSNTFESLAIADSIAAASSAQCILPSLVAATKDVRDSSLKAKESFTDMWARTYTDVGLYQVLKGVEKNYFQEIQTLIPEQKRFIKKTLHLFESNGMHLAPDNRARLASLREKISALSERFCANINEDTTTTTYSLDDLQGVDEAFYKYLPREGELVKIGCKRPQYLALMLGATNELTRKKMQKTADSRCMAQNIPILEEILQLRHEAAQLLGVPSHAALILATKMAKTPANVLSFLETISRNQETEFSTDFELLQKTKNILFGNSEVKSWDISFLKKKAQEKFLGLDEDKVKEYFPLEHVVPEILSVYSEVLGLKFRRLTDVPVWHPTVVAYAVTDATSDTLLGYFYLDLFSRDGKYAHQCVFPIIPSFSGTKSVCAILGNFSQPTPERPALLLFDEVKTFFHEFGHVMHCVLTEVHYSLFAWAWAIVPWPGGGVEQDFLEVPSMMFELWMYEEEVLQRLSGHFRNRSEKLPMEIIKKIGKSQFFLQNLQKRMTVALALYDLILHGGPPPHYTYGTTGGLDLIGCFDRVIADIARQRPQEGTFRGASWYHPCMGYDAGYYGYIWSEVYAHDLFRKFRESPRGCLDSGEGKKIRECLLARGATWDGEVMMREFLGREPNMEAYLGRFKKQDL